MIFGGEWEIWFLNQYINPAKSNRRYGTVLCVRCILYRGILSVGTLSFYRNTICRFSISSLPRKNILRAYLVHMYVFLRIYIHEDTVLCLGLHIKEK